MVATVPTVAYMVFSTKFVVMIGGALRDLTRNSGYVTTGATGMDWVGDWLCCS